MKIAIDIILALVRSSSEIAAVISSIAGVDQATIEARLVRARASIVDPIDTATEDAAHRAELEAILRGQG